MDFPFRYLHLALAGALAIGAASAATAEASASETKRFEIPGGDLFGFTTPAQRTRPGEHDIAAELSTTEADAVVFAATATLVRHDRSVVLIDRPELSADERSIVTWLDAVRGLGEDSQLILASSSPALLASVEPGAIINLEA